MAMHNSLCVVFTCSVNGLMLKFCLYDFKSITSPQQIEAMASGSKYGRCKQPLYISLSSFTCMQRSAVLGKMIRSKTPVTLVAQ